MNTTKMIKKTGERIRTIRKIKGLTQEELAERADLSDKFIGEIERGEVNPSLDSLYKISQGLEINIIELFPNGNDVVSLFANQDVPTIKGAIKTLNRLLKKD
jgi:transcriptional regulator with XRE-family HTH domain